MAEPFVLEGKALHSGQPSRIHVRPGRPDTGVVFDVGGTRIPVSLSAVCSSPRCTVLRNGITRVETVEHLLAAFRACGVDNAIVATSNPEMPALDGSALPLVRELDRVGLAELEGSARKVLVLKRPVFVTQNGTKGLAVPFDGFRVTAAVQFPEPVGEQVVDYPDVSRAFRELIAPARTPGFLREWDELKALGLALGAGPDNVLPIFDDRYGDELRVPDEVAAHKALDLIGDLALLGAEIRAHITTCRGGHSLNHAICQAMVENSELEH